MPLKIYDPIRCPFCTSYIRKRKWYTIGYYTNRKPVYIECPFHGIFGYLVYNKDLTRKKYWMKNWNPEDKINWGKYGGKQCG